MMFSVLWPFCASGSIFLQSLSGETKESNARPASSNISTALLLGRAAHTEVTASRAHHWVQNIFKSYFIVRLTTLSWKPATFLGLWESILLHSNPGCPSDTFFFCGNTQKFDHGTWRWVRPFWLQPFWIHPLSFLCSEKEVLCLLCLTSLSKLKNILDILLFVLD